MLDLLHIEDLISALVIALKENFIGTVNLGAGVLHSTLSISEIIRDWFNASSCIEQIKINSYFSSISMNSDYAKSQLNWSPTISCEQGLNRLLSEITLKETNYEH
jgi:nucleoside-diphosphate-sugar epimerase